MSVEICSQLARQQSSIRQLLFLLLPCRFLLLWVMKEWDFDLERTDTNAASLLFTLALPPSVWGAALCTSVRTYSFYTCSRLDVGGNEQNKVPIIGDKCDAADEEPSEISSDCKRSIFVGFGSKLSPASSG